MPADSRVEENNWLKRRMNNEEYPDQQQENRDNFGNRNKQRKFDMGNAIQVKNKDSPPGDLEGKKFRAPFNNRYHDVIVEFAPRNVTDISDLKVKVKFLNPTTKKMTPCQFYFDPRKKCAYTDFNCQYSHGEWMDYSELKEYVEPDCDRSFEGDQNTTSGEDTTESTHQDGRKILDHTVRAEESGEVDTGEKSNGLNVENSNCLEGMKCRAPFLDHQGQITLHDAQIIYAPKHVSDMNNLRVKVKFLNPTDQAMIPCRYHFEVGKKCAFGDGSCRYSHGEAVLYKDLEEYVPAKPDDSKAESAGSKSNNSLNEWKKHTKVKLTGEGVLELESVLTSDDNVLSSLVGKKYRAPYKCQRKNLSYHNVMICSVPPEVPTSYDLEVKVIYLNPVCPEMLPCHFYFDPNKSCAFNSKKCMHSHGEIVPLASLQSYVHFESKDFTLGMKVLAKHRNRLWYDGELQEISNKVCIVQFEGNSSRVFKEISLQDVVPLIALGTEKSYEAVKQPDKFKYLEDMKCRALFKHPKGDLRYNNALICAVDENVYKNTTLEELQVKVRYLNPTNREMLPCPYYFNANKKCGFTSETCMHSHGEWVPFFSVQDYIEPDYDSLRKGSEVLVKWDVNNLWHKGKIEEINTNDKYLVRVQTQQHYIYKDIHKNDVVPLELPQLHEFNLSLLNE